MTSTANSTQQPGATHKLVCGCGLAKAHKARTALPLRCFATMWLLILWVWTQAQAATLSGGVFHIEYQAPDGAIAEHSLAVLEEARAEFAQRLPAGDEPIHVMICHTPMEFARYAVGFGKGRVAGLAESEAGLIVVKPPRLQQPGADYTGILRHELTHVLLRRNVNLDHLPRWLNEGICMVLSREYRWASSVRVARMYAGGRLIAYKDLDLSLTYAGSDWAFTDAYAQSYSMTRFLMTRLGDDGFWDLVDSLDSMSFGLALKARTSLTPLELWETWRRSLWKVALLSGIMSGFTAFQVMAILTVAAYVRKRRRGQRILRQWEQEEEGGPVLYVWDAAERESQYPWEEDEEDDRW